MHSPLKSLKIRKAVRQNTFIMLFLWSSRKYYFEHFIVFKFSDSLNCFIFSSQLLQKFPAISLQFSVLKLVLRYLSWRQIMILCIM